MSNKLYNDIAGGMPQNNMMNLLNQYRQFRANFRGDPKAEVEKLVSSGRISQQQINQAMQMAQQIQRLMMK